MWVILGMLTFSEILIMLAVRMFGNVNENVWECRYALVVEDFCELCMWCCDTVALE